MGWRGRPRAAALGADSGVGEVERLIDDRERLAELILGDRQRRVVVDRVPAGQGVEAVVAQVLGDLLHLVAGAVVRRVWLVRLLVADELEDAEQADVAAGADA